MKGTLGIQILKPEPFSLKLPLDLLGGKSYTAYFHGNDLVSMMRKNGHEPSELRYAFFGTQSGKEYNVKLHKNFGLNLQKFVETNLSDSRV